MISKVLIVVAVILILPGLIGIRTRSIGHKLVFLITTSIGVLLLPFSQGKTQFGILGGIWQVLFQGPALLCFVLLIKSICKRNGIWNVEELTGVRESMPYLFAAGVVFAIVLIGLPGTGTFIGYLYSAFGLMTGEFGVYSYIGLAGILLGIVIYAAITFSILKSAYLPGDKMQRISSKADGVFVALAFLFILYCIFQNQIVAVVSTLVGKIFS